MQRYVLGAERTVDPLMPWVRFEDKFPIHRKVWPLDDATYRLYTEAVFWCARETTDGRIIQADLGSVSKRASTRRAAVLVERGLWHAAGYECPSPNCPTSGEDGWVIHDYLEYQPTKVKVKADLAAKAERTRQWRERKAGKKPPGDASPPDHETGTYPDGDASPSPPRPAPKGRVGTTSPRPSPAANGGVAAAGADAQPCPTCGNAPTSAYHLGACLRSAGAA